jgi:hypothetical protein
VVEQVKDAYLTDIRFQYNNTTIPGFNPTNYNYTVDYPYSAPLLPKINVYASSPTANLFYFEQKTTPPYTQNVMVYSEDMNVNKVYSVSFNLVKNTNPFFVFILINGISLQNFNSQIFDYEYDFPYTEMNAPVVTAIPVHPYAEVVITQIDSINGTVTIEVTAEDDEFSSTYTIDFSRDLSPVKSIETIIYEYENENYTFEFPIEETEVTIMLPMETLEIPVILEVLLSDNRSAYIIDEQPDEENDLTGVIMVTAEDETEETYFISFERTLSSSTLLTGIYYDETLVPDFDPNTLSYFILLPFDHYEIPIITATAAWQGTNVVTQNPNTPFGTGSVIVTSEDGDHTQTYSIVFQRKGNPYLVDLYYTLDGEPYPIPDFDPETFEYYISLPIGTTETPTVEYFPEDNTCIITDEQPASPNGTGWVKLVTWNNDETVTYTVHFSVTLSQEALLIDLLVDGVTIVNFNSNTFHYSFPEYEYGTEPFPPLAVTAVAKHPDAMVNITQIEDYPGVATVLVTAGETSFTNTYSISFSVEPGNNTFLDTIYLDGAPLMGFNKKQYFYEFQLNYEDPQVPNVVGIPEDSRSEVDTEQAQQPDDTAKIWVTALNGDVALYQVHFLPGKNNNAYLQMIYIDGKPLENFVHYLPNYTYPLPFNYTGIPWVTYEKQDPNADAVKEDLNSNPPQTKIFVTAEDGIIKFTYTITFLRESSVVTYNNETAIEVYPNPSSDIVHFAINGLHQTGYLEIITLEGKTLGKHILQDGINAVNIEHLANGLYFYKIFTDKTMIGTGKFVKK